MIEKSIAASGVKTVIIDGDTVFRIKINTLNTEDISIKTRSEGEYGGQNVLTAETKQDTLFISSKLQPFFVDADNKSTAHKVIATNLEMAIPKHLNVYIKSDIATTDIAGEYNKITIELINGNCILNSFKGDAIINTIYGYINVFTNHAKVEANTKNGNLSIEHLDIETYTLKLNSINGNITVKKIE